MMEEHRDDTPPSRLRESERREAPLLLLVPVFSA